MILAGDIGGTKTNIAFFEDAKRPDVVAQETFPSRAHAGLEEIVRQFISQHALRVRHTAFGVAGVNIVVTRKKHDHRARVPAG